MKKHVKSNSLRIWILLILLSVGIKVTHASDFRWKVVHNMCIAHFIENLDDKDKLLSYYDKLYNNGARFEILKEEKRGKSDTESIFIVEYSVYQTEYLIRYIVDYHNLKIYLLSFGTKYWSFYPKGSMSLLRSAYNEKRSDLISIYDAIMPKNYLFLSKQDSLISTFTRKFGINGVDSNAFLVNINYLENGLYAVSSTDKRCYIELSAIPGKVRFYRNDIPYEKLKINEFCGQHSIRAPILRLKSMNY